MSMRGPAKRRGSGLKLPRSCPINFDFSVDRIECKTCRYFEVCLRIYSKAMKLASKASRK